MFNFPWTNFHELNLDWILSVVKEAKEIFDNGREDIDYAVSTADEAKEIATQAAEATIADNSISTAKIQNSAVTTAKLANNSVTTDKIADRTIIGNDIAENTIESYNIKNGTIIGADIAQNTITYENLASGAVTTTRLGDSAVTGAKIANGSVSGAKLESQLYNYIYREWQATGFNPTAETIANIIATAGDIIVRCFIPSVNFDCFVAVPPITLRNMSGTHIICAGGYYGDPTATLEIRLNASSTNISLNKCSLNGADTAADIQLIFK